MKAVFIILFPFVVGVCDHFLGAAAPCAHVGTYSWGHQVLIRAAGDWTVCKHAVNISIHYQIVHSTYHVYHEMIPSGGQFHAQEGD